MSDIPRQFPCLLLTSLMMMLFCHGDRDPWPHPQPFTGSPAPWEQAPTRHWLRECISNHFSNSETVAEASLKNEVGMPMYQPVAELPCPQKHALHPTYSSSSPQGVLLLNDYLRKVDTLARSHTLATSSHALRFLSAD